MLPTLACTRHGHSSLPAALNGNPLRVALLYTESHLTPWKENVNKETLLHLASNAPQDVLPAIIHFEGFEQNLASQLRSFDVVFNLCYGYQDAGQVEVAEWLSRHGITHTASAPAAMRKAQDKALLPVFCRELGLHTPDILESPEALDDKTLYLRKPRFGSCHRGIDIETGAWFKARYTLREPDFLVQPYIQGREFSVGVISNQDGADFECLPPVEIFPEDGSVVYTAGKAFGKTHRCFSPKLSSHVEAELYRAALSLHKHLGLSGMSRTDFRCDAEGRVYVLDVNALPNLDPVRSLMPAICEHAGISVTELMRRTLAQTLQRHRSALTSAVL